MRWTITRFRVLLLLGVALIATISSACSQNTPAGTNTARSELTPEPETTLVFNAVGDIMLSRGVAASADRAGAADYPFSRLKDEFLDADFNFGNLESPVSGNEKRKGKGLVFNARRDHVRPLADYKFRVVNLANNHSMDQGLKGLLYTRTFLDEIGVKHTGTGQNLAEAWKPAIIEANGMRIAFVGASDASFNDGGVAKNDYVARCEDVEHLRKAIKAASEISDLVVATMHAGVEYITRPDKTQIAFAHAAVEAGADIVIGAHPHWIQTIEEYKGRPIFYSLGNFVFDQPWAATRTGLMLRIIVRKGGSFGPRAAIDEIEIRPVVIENRGVPRLANASEVTSILKKIGVTDTKIRPKQEPH